MEYDPEQHIKRLYQRLAAQDMRVLLDDMLFDLKFTTRCESEGDMALNNYAKMLLSKVYADQDGVVESNKLFEMIRRLVRRRNK